MRTTSAFIALLISIDLTWLPAQDRVEVREGSTTEKQLFSEDLDRIKELVDSFTPGPKNDLHKYEEFADTIRQQWRSRSREVFARVTLALCGPLSSGRFNDQRQYELAREYALSALESRDLLPVILELDLIGHVNSQAPTSRQPNDTIASERRKADVEVRLHAWKRLLNSIDPKWDPAEAISPKVPLPPGVDGVSGMAPEDIKDKALRAQYEAAIKETQQKIQRHMEQRQLRARLKEFPKRAENYIIQAYSKPPFSLPELRELLTRYDADAAVRARVLEAVTKNNEKGTERKK
jgi:hypothetical protein